MQSHKKSILNLFFTLSLLINHGYSNYNERFKRIPDRILNLPFSYGNADGDELEQSTMLKKLAIATAQLDKGSPENPQKNDERITRAYGICYSHDHCETHQYCSAGFHCHARCRNRRRRGENFYSPGEIMAEEDYQYHRSRRCSLRDSNDNGECFSQKHCGCNRHCSCHNYCAPLPNR